MPRTLYLVICTPLWFSVEKAVLVTHRFTMAKHGGTFSIPHDFTPWCCLYPFNYQTLMIQDNVIVSETKDDAYCIMAASFHTLASPQRACLSPTAFHHNERFFPPTTATANNLQFCTKSVTFFW